MALRPPWASVATVDSRRPFAEVFRGRSLRIVSRAFRVCESLGQPDERSSALDGRSATGSIHRSGTGKRQVGEGCEVRVASMKSCFVEHRELGLGRLSFDGSKVFFFDSPAATEKEEAFDAGSFRAVSLSPEERVWWFDGGRWMVGRVGHYDEAIGSYKVLFPNNLTLDIPQDELRVRWRKPLEDVLGMLKAFTSETSFFHERRSRFLRTLSQQEAACQGLGGLLSAGVELYQHQLGAARRVLQDPVRRYLLADEVGLGKTIEAGLVARQLLFEAPGDVLVIVPRALVAQWRDELDSKFRLETLGGRVTVVDHDDLESLALSPRHVRLLIVDEAHRLTTWEGSNDTAYRNFERLQALSVATDALLLLSATPVRSNEDAFLRLLNLLDPVNYDINDLEGFRTRVAMRDELAELMLGLDPGIPASFLIDAAKAVVELLPADPDVALLVERLVDAAESRVDGTPSFEVQRLRSHLSETYRIHRRMIRNRRTDSLCAEFPVRGRTRSGDWLLVDADPRRQRLPHFLDDVRLELIDHGDSELALATLRMVLSRVLAPIEGLGALATELRSGLLLDSTPEEFDVVCRLRETLLAPRLAGLIDSVTKIGADSGRLEALAEWLFARRASDKVVFACSSPFLASLLNDRLRARCGPNRVAAVLNDMSTSDRGQALRRFSEEALCVALVIDRTAEEGMNLQMVTEVVHVDLPVSSSRLEQRMGRFDRWSRTHHQAVRSLTFREADDDLEAVLGSWRQVLDEVFGIFRASTATLQYVLPGLEDRFLREFLDEGPGSAYRTLSSLKTELDTDRRRIIGQDMLDSLEDVALDEELFDDMVEVDQQGSILTDVRGYVGDCLGISIAGVGASNGAAGGDRRRPLMPTAVADRLIGRELQSGVNRIAYDHERSRAMGSGRRLLRWGEPLLTRFLDYAMVDSRGRTFIDEVPVENLPTSTPPIFIFVFDFRVGWNDMELDMLPVDARTSVASVARRYLAPHYERVAMVVGADTVQPHQIEALLKRQRIHLGSRPERLAELTGTVAWEAMCDHSFRKAQGMVTARIDANGMVATALARIDRDRAQSESINEARRRVGYRIDDVVADYVDAIRKGVAGYRVDLDCCGVVIATGLRPS